VARSAFRWDDPPEPPAWHPAYGGSVGCLLLWVAGSVGGLVLVALGLGAVHVHLGWGVWAGLAVSQLVRSGGLVGQVGPGLGAGYVGADGGAVATRGGGPTLGVSFGFWVCSECIMYAAVAGGQ
jgi:hypothetical protein